MVNNEGKHSGRGMNTKRNKGRKYREYFKCTNTYCTTWSLTIRKFLGSWAEKQ